MNIPLLKLRELIKKNKLDAVLISSHSNIVYLTDYSGFSKEEREAYLFITNTKQYILTDGRYTEGVKALIPDFKLIEISSKLPFEKALKEIIKNHKIKKLGFEGDNISFLEHKKLSRLPDGFNHFTSKKLRSVKTAEEIIKIGKACKLGDKTFKFILGKIKKGVSEKEIANEIEFFIKRHGADISFRPIVAFGKNSAIPHHVPTFNSQLSTLNSIVLLDFGVKLNNYCSDMTRTIFLGKPTPEQKKMYETVLEAQSLAIESIARCHAEFISASKIKTGSRNKFGMTGKEVDKAARDYIISKGYKTIPHSVGHGIGIEVHETPHLSPKSKDTLKEGMVFSIEPGIYLPNFGGIRIEDLVVIEKNGLRLLTRCSRKLIEL